MSSESKNVSHTSDFEIDVEEVHISSQARVLKAVDAARVSFTALALLASITVLGVSADALAVYDATHVPAHYLLPLWPDAFDLRPTVALVVGSSILIVANIVSLLFSRVQSSWSCRWSEVVMVTRPHFGTLCKQSKAGLYLSVLLLPIEAIILGAGAYQMILQRNIGRTSRVVQERRKSGSPVPSSVRDIEGEQH
ncbi:uncharacterized protein ColSpa_04129 [Colletotrichum spaethianum]|uniref:Uncharacterized protein n=1 Tax=Colletotrichum spaethianum TaxID=700344 RepID=A0AA37L8T5_9PEZI|nr:uncharacterized protein ColSpa_04129 [Colletotrichum spaethianum]GKT43948.1 hypothetical protein ColSpa_04129 [Colletotrichum spaethianum]